MKVSDFESDTVALSGAPSVGLMARDLHRALKAAIDERVARFGLTSNACRYLALMVGRDGITPGEMSAFLRVRSPTTVAALRTLERKRLISGSRDRQDGRKTLYRLTAKGREIEAMVRESAMEVEQKAVAALSGKQLEQFREMIEIVHRSLEEQLGDDGITGEPASKL